MRIQRPFYLELLANKRDNGMIKIITGIRRVGKSYLLKEIYKDYLLKDGVNKNQIIMLDLDEVKNAKYRNPFEMDAYIRNLTKDTKKKSSQIKKDVSKKNKESVFSLMKRFITSEQFPRVVAVFFALFTYKNSKL